ncbi:uncharacterized protein cmet isoform X2 [Drosophila kikkawai]|uniref:Uncharacterized protein cmet isoform X2 n=1 Tax=Drosophila kikkawai TaxID=30033 RepID=A0A6P4IW12_DROKI|nr:kinesin-like protein KIN-7I isoform X2 [Drosophila kikkawai]
MSAKGANSIQVCIKLRPCEPGNASLWQVKEGRSIQLAESHAEPSVFDYVFDEGAGNQEVFDRMAQHIVRACMQGFNGTIFAYGQTSSGKTYTMMGDCQNPGVMVLAAKEIFQHIANDTERDFLLRVGYIEIYNEKIYDLLNKKNQDLKIHEAGNGIVNVNCEELIITSEDDLLRLLSSGNKERTVGETNMNERSSRSHAIFRIIIESRKSDRTDDEAVIQSVLNLVDLAGSERAGQTGATGARLKEGAHINKSLMFLSNVIKNLSENVDNKFISFRDSKLTRILQASLGGNAFTSIICTIKPSIMEESQSTLSFAMRAKKIRIKPQLNEMVSDATMMKRLEREIKTLKSQLAEEKRKKESQLMVQDLERRLKTDELKIISSTSLNDQRQQKRRRTWCPAPTGPDASLTSLTGILNDSRLMRPSNLSNLPKPTFFATSNAAYRGKTAPKTINILSSLDITTDEETNEEFVPAECVKFDTPPQLWAQKAMLKSRKVPNLSLTPVPNPMEPETCKAMQDEVTRLTVATEAANSKIVEYEKELKALKQTVAKLDLENREAVSLEFQFEAYKKKASLREKDLLSALSEKELAVENLQRSLDELSRDMVHNSKEALMRSMYPNLADIEEATLNESDVNEDSKKVDCECDRLRSEIVATQAKLEKMQADFDLAISEASHKKEDCQRLSEQISKAQDDFTLLQGRYEAQQEVIQAMQADFQAIQHKYHKLQEEYETLGRTSQASEDQCQQLHADNSSLRLEVGALKKELVDGGQELKTHTDELKAKLAEMTSNFNALQEEYDSLSNQLMESVQENDALREELKQRPLPSYDMESMRSSGVDSMKSSGVETELGEPEQEAISHNYIGEKFAKLSESIHQIELKSHLGFSRLFRVSKPEKELENNVKALKLCLESAKYIESETAADGIPLKGVVKQQMFQLVALSQEQLEAGEEQRLLNIIAQLEQEVRDKNELMEATEATINEMREQMTNLESELLEKSVIVNKVEDYQRQIETLEKQNAEMTMVYEELQDKVQRNSSMSESTLHLLPVDETISAPHESCASEMTPLSELQTKVVELQAEMENLVRQMQLKDTNIADLKAEIEEIRERCLSSEVKLVEVENDAREKQQLLDRQARKLSDDALLIDQLQEKNAKLQERIIKEELQAKQDHTIPSSEYEQQIKELRESLSRVQDELIKMEKLKTDEINALQLEYMMKMERSEDENRAKFRGYTQELGESRDRHENDMAKLREQILQAEEELSRLKNSCQAELEERVTLQEKLSQMEEEKRKVTVQYEEKLEASRKNLQEKIAEAESKAALLQAELKVTTDTLNEKLAEVEAKQAYINDITFQRHSKEATIAEQKSALDKLRMENQKLLEQLQMLPNDHEQHSEQLASTNIKIKELTAKCDQHVLDLNNLKQEKVDLQAEINEHLSTKNSLQKLQMEMEAQSQKQLKAESDFKEQSTAFATKISELEEALQSSQLKAVCHDDLVSKHNELITSSNGKIQELQEKYEQQLRDLDTLRQEKSILLAKIDEADAQHSSTLKQLHELEMHKEERSQKWSTEKIDLEEKLETMKAKISDLETELQSARLKAASLEELNSQHQDLKLSLSEATGVSSTLQEKVDSLQSQLLASEKDISSRDLEKERLLSELKHALEARDTVSADQLALTTQLKAMEEKMASQEGDLRKELADLNSSMNELQFKLKSLEEQKIALESDNDELKVKLRNAHNLQDQLEEEQKLCASLRTQFAELEETKTRLEEELRIKEAETKAKFVVMSQEVELGRHSIEQLTKECDKLRSDLETKTNSFHKENERLNSTLSSLSKDKQLLEERISSLSLNDSRNAELIAKLRAKEDEAESLREASISQKQAADAANLRCRQFMEQKAELTQEIEKLRTTLKSKEASVLIERESMNATISSLLEDKRNLEEKQCTLNDIIVKLEAELSTLQALRSNSSFESNTSTGSAPRKSLDRNPPASFSKKSAGYESEMRKTRRLSAYDEHRRQSYWNDVRDCGTMTDPVDNNCNCTELDSKLQACQQELFIRESQVTALSLELKHHPLKDENAQLKNRVLEEQEKARSEQKRLKMKIQDLNAKVNDLSNAVKSPPTPVPEPKPSSVLPSASAHTQTECQLEKKYQDALVLLRSRYHLIKDLEEKLKQNENTDTSNVSSLTSGQINSLKKQCETLKKELASVREKYDTAKRVLMMRKDEMVQMRLQLNAFESAAAAAPK